MGKPKPTWLLPVCGLHVTSNVWVSMAWMLLMLGWPGAGRERFYINAQYQDRGSILILCTYTWVCLYTSRCVWLCVKIYIAFIYSIFSNSFYLGLGVRRYILYITFIYFLNCFYMGLGIAMLFFNPTHLCHYISLFDCNQVTTFDYNIDLREL